ncbi:phosphoribosyl transferase domain protein [Penicillium nucicola]|uniref:phosphoribosyl transferase domain protein n=1 Tax=Penicillium nucicola TaxID=1850975 RepID=UPI002545AB18|nr:phosphoribosyl transferase domain protein [Penicillium nucicola]KAJ5742592.1 phosphoribosyl transferase domain protein [Penicillium nucicola]
MAPGFGPWTSQRLKLDRFDTRVAGKLPHSSSADEYLYWDAGQLHLGITMLESFTPGLVAESRMSTSFASPILGPEDNYNIVDSIGLFETEMYMSKMHGGHGEGKTSSFKRCLFLKNIGAVADVLLAAMETRPTENCFSPSLARWRGGP